jgi:hypothetical protein
LARLSVIDLNLSLIKIYTALLQQPAHDHVELIVNVALSMLAQAEPELTSGGFG